MSKKHLCIYHDECADGFGAALAVKKYWDKQGVPDRDREYLAASYGDTPPDVTGRHVEIVDFSYGRVDLIEMHRKAESLVVIDHHKTAQQALDGLDFCHFDMTQSGAMLAWRLYMGDRFIPNLIHYIQDRDLWKWSLAHSKEVSAALQSLPFDLEVWEQYLDDELIERLVDMGGPVLQYQERRIHSAMKHQRDMVYIAGHLVPCMNATHLVSEIGNSLSDGYPFSITYFDKPNERVYSLRSKQNGVDVSDIAKSLGGGGHKHSAGFTIKGSELLVNVFGEDSESLIVDISVSPEEQLAFDKTKVMDKGSFYRLPEYNG